MKCPYCGNDESPDSKFCGNCGQPLQQQVSQAAPASQPAVSQMPQPSAAQQPATPAVPLPGGTSGAAPACCPTGVAASPAVRPAVRCRSLDSGRARNPAISGDAGRARENAEAQIQGQAHRPHRGRGDRPRVGYRSCPVLHVSRGHLGRNPAAYRRRDLRCVRRRSHRR